MLSVTADRIYLLRGYGTIVTGTGQRAVGGGVKSHEASPLGGPVGAALSTGYGSPAVSSGRGAPVRVCLMYFCFFTPKYLST